MIIYNYLSLSYQSHLLLRHEEYSNSFRLYLFSLVHTIFDCRMVAMQMRGSGSRFDRKRPSVFDDNEEDLKPGKWKWVWVHYVMKGLAQPWLSLQPLGTLSKQSFLKRRKKTLKKWFSFKSQGQWHWFLMKDNYDGYLGIHPHVMPHYPQDDV